MVVVRVLCSVVPVWIGFENLPVHLLKKGFSFSMVRAVGNPLKLDELTSNPTRPNIARILLGVGTSKTNSKS